MSDAPRSRSPRLYLASGPIRTGKTTRLRAWSDGLNTLDNSISRVTVRVDGVLAPVHDGERHLLHVASGEMRNLEELPADAPVVAVRRFRFNGHVFAWAREILAGVPDHAEWVIVDEIGPLELSGDGLEPAVTQLLARFADSRNGPAIVLVVRDSLVHEALRHLGLTSADVRPFNP